MCLRSVSAVSSSPDLISLLDSLSAFRHPYVLCSFVATYLRYFRCNTGCRCLGTRHRRLGFLGGQRTPQPNTYRIVGSKERKQKRLEQEERPGKNGRNEPRCGKRPIISMILHWGNQKKLGSVLLDTGCTVPLVSQRLSSEEDLPRRKREEPATLRSCLGEVVTLGLYCNRSVGRIKGNQATFDNSQRNNLRSCVCVFGGSVGEDVRAGFSSVSERNLFLFMVEAIA